MDEAEILLLCRTHPREGFQRLLLRYQAQAMRHAVMITGNREDALDALQDACIDAFTALERFDPRRRFYPWFYTILRNRCLRIMRPRSRRVALTEDLADPSPASSAQEDVSNTERALSRLSGDERELLLLKHVEDWTCDELAEALEIPAGTVMSRLHTARLRLRRVIEEQQDKEKSHERTSP